jgi:hypothetical protein
VERLGARVPAREVLEKVFERHKRGGLDASDRSCIEQELSILEGFCGDRFRAFLFPDKFTQGLGLSESFAGEYFVFRRL